MKVNTLDEGAIRDIGHAFGYYDYGAERGLIDLFLGRDAVASYIAAMCARGCSAACSMRRANAARALSPSSAPAKKNRRAGGACAAAGTAWFDERAGVAALCARHGKERRRP